MSILDSSTFCNLSKMSSGSSMNSIMRARSQSNRQFGRTITNHANLVDGNVAGTDQDNVNFIRAVTKRGSNENVPAFLKSPKLKIKKMQCLTKVKEKSRV